MPATYAHWRFGCDCIEKMPTELQDIIKQHRDIYDLGVHGPDILFYDLAHKDILNIGYKMHKEPARNFFEKSKDIYKESEDKDATLAYLLGFLSHFVLDSSCHGYVERKKEFTGITHSLVESQWDRHLIVSDKRVANLVDRAESLKPNKQNAKVISQFFPCNEKEILRSTKAQRMIITLLNCMYETKQKILREVLFALGLNDYADLFIGFKEEETCEDSNLRLDKLKAKAIKLYPKLLNNYLAYLKGKEKLIKYFDHTFDQWNDYKDIPILSYEDELNYKV